MNANDRLTELFDRYSENPDSLTAAEVKEMDDLFYLMDYCSDEYEGE